jgi:hypothetical protein
MRSIILFHPRIQIIYFYFRGAISMNLHLLQAIKPYIKLVFTFASTTCLISPVMADKPSATDKDSIVIENFSPNPGKEKRIPKDWKASRDDLSMFSFGNENGNFYTTVSSSNDCTSIGTIYPYSSEQFPILNWKWRVHKLPDGATELERRKNDSGAGIYVIFKGAFKLNNIIKYVWSSTLPIGTQTTSPYNKNTKIIVLQSGVDKTNRWITESVNVYEDYTRLFKSKPPKVEGFGILTDSDNTKSSAIADYDDLILSHDNGSVVSSK